MNSKSDTTENPIRPIKHDLTNPDRLTPSEKSELVHAFMGMYNSRDMLMDTLRSLQNLDAVQTILDVIIDDAFFGSADLKVFTASYEGPEGDLTDSINKDITVFVKKMQLNAFIRNITEDLLLYGEYPYRIEGEQGKGITEIRDDVDPTSVIAVYEKSEPEFFLEKKGTKINVRQPYEMGHFCLSPRKVRVRLSEKEQKKKQLAEYVRIGRPIIYPAISKLKRLQVHEQAVVAESLKRLLLPTYVTVAVPASTSTEDMPEIIKKYERILQSPGQTMLSPDDLTTADLFEMVGRIKVIPTFTDGKGAIAQLEPLSNVAELDEREQKLRSAIAMAVGIPQYYLVQAATETPSSKLETLKVYSRYSRRLVMVQEAVATGLRRLLKTHLALTGKNVDEETIKIKFKSIVNVDLLDSMEYSVASVATLQELFQTLELIANSSALRVRVNSKNFVGLAAKFLQPLGEVGSLLEEIKDEEMTPGAPGTVPTNSQEPVPEPVPEPDTAAPKMRSDFRRIQKQKDVLPLKKMPTPVSGTDVPAPNPPEGGSQKDTNSSAAFDTGSTTATLPTQAAP